MARPGAGWMCGSALHLDGGLAVSFQRYPRPADGIVPALPRSFGALPVAFRRYGDAAQGAGGLPARIVATRRRVRPPRKDSGGSAGARQCLVPVADAEAVWLGLSLDAAAAPVMLACAVVSACGAPVDAVTGAPWAARRAGRTMVPPSRWLDGVRRPDGRTTAFMRDGPGRAPAGCAGLHLYGTSEPGEPEDLASGGLRLLASVWLVAPAEFARRSGCPAPALMRADDAYPGWRLP